MIFRRFMVTAGTATIVVGALTLLSRVTGFSRWLVFSGTVGATCVGSAYSTANQLPNVLFEVVVGGALAASVVPVVSGVLITAGRESANRVASALLTWAILILVPFAFLVIWLAEPLMTVLLNGNGCPGQVQVASHMLQVFAPQIVLYGVAAVFGGVLHSHGRFVWPAFAPVLSSVTVIGAYLGFAAVTSRPQGLDATAWLASSSARAIVAWGTTLGVVVLAMPLLWPLWRAGVRLRPTLRFESQAGARVRSLALTGLSTLVMQQIFILAAFRFANAGGVGTINVYQYIQALILLPYAVLVAPVVTTVFPSLASQAAALNLKNFARMTRSSSQVVLVMAASGTALLLATAPAAGGLFASLDVPSTALAALPDGLVAFTPGVFGFAFLIHYGNVLMSLGAARHAGWSAASGWGIATVASWLFIQTGSFQANPTRTLIGLGLGYSVGMLLGAASMTFFVVKARASGQRLLTFRAVWKRLSRGILVLILAGLVGRLVTDLIPPEGAWWAFCAGIFGATAVLGVFVLGLLTVDRSSWRLLRGFIAGRAWDENASNETAVSQS
ncbi:MAG: murein biosynthesis integral membrane protein MurJ [Actinomycetota bacterium]